MRRLSLSVAAVGAVILLAGCLQVNTTIAVNRDGSGTIDQTFLMKSEMVDMMSGLNAMGDSQSSDQKASGEFSLYDEKQLRDDAAKMGPDVTVVRSEPLKTDWGQGYHVVYAFKDITKIQVNQNPGDSLPSKMSQGESETQQSPEYMRFGFSKGNPAVLTVSLPQPKQEKTNGEGKSKASTAKMSDDDIAMFTQFYRDMRITVDLKVNGSIVSTNSSYRSGNTVTLMDFQFNALLDNPDFKRKLKEGNSDEMSNFQNLATMFPGLKIEPKRSIEVRFR